MTRTANERERAPLKRARVNLVMPPAPLTVIEVCHDVAPGNTLYIRGQDDGLSWDPGSGSAAASAADGFGPPARPRAACDSGCCSTIEFGQREGTSSLRLARTLLQHWQQGGSASEPTGELRWCRALRS
jgi:hypothetical protein